LRSSMTALVIAIMVGIARGAGTATASN